MTFFRLIKPLWGQPRLVNGEDNPRFVREIQGDNTIEGLDYTEEFLKEKNDLGYNIYFFPNHPSTDVYAAGIKNLSGKMIDVFNYVFVDMDLKDEVYKSKEEFLDVLAQFQLKPTMVVDSGHGIHAYWHIDGLTRDEYVTANVALLNHFKTDESVYTVLQLLRYPGFFNTKNLEKPILATVIESHSSGLSYNLGQFPPEIFNLDKTQVTKVQNHLNKLDGKLKLNLPDLTNIDELPDKFIDFLEDRRNVAAYNLFHSPKATTGDRSAADMRLANILYRADFNRKETLAVIANTEKALEKAGSRFAYAELTVDKVYADRLVEEFMTVGQTIRTVNLEENLGAMVRGPWYFDYEVLGEPWRKKETMGLIAGSGIGKTTLTLNIVKDSIENNPDNDDVYLFFSLEMTEAEIVNRWVKLVGRDSALADRLFVIGNENRNGDNRNIGLQEVVEIAEKIKKHTGKGLGMVAIDHIGILARHIDIRKFHQFGIMSEAGAGWSDIRTLSLNSLATQLKTLSKLLDTYLIVLTQTTKDKGQGDKPIEKDGAYGISQYENIMDRIITIWQPLMRVQSYTPLRFLAWQYVKIRNKHPNDQIQVNVPKLMTYDLATGDLKLTTKPEYEEFKKLEPMAKEIRKNLMEDRKNGKSGHVSYSIEIGKLDSKVRSLLGVSKDKGSTDVAKTQSN